MGVGDAAEGAGTGELAEGDLVGIGQTIWSMVQTKARMPTSSLRLSSLRIGGESVNPYNPSTSEGTLTSQYVSFGDTAHVTFCEWDI